MSVAVKFLWPVGGALMQCFKARKPSGSESREGEKEGREERRRGGGREGGEEGRDAAADTDASPRRPHHHHPTERLSEVQGYDTDLKGRGQLLIFAVQVFVVVVIVQLLSLSLHPQTPPIMLSTISGLNLEVVS